MKSRSEAEKLILKQFNSTKPGYCWHYGRWELQELLDFIYESEETALERLINKDTTTTTIKSLFKEPEPPK